MNERPNIPLNENEHVRELLNILKDNGKDASGLTALLGYVNTMESQLNKAVDELQSVRQELGNMREERDHPLRTAMQKAANTMEANITEARSQLEEIKIKIIEGCKQAIAAFKEKGISALNGIANFFRIKPALESMRKNLENGVKKDNAAIDRIEAMSAEYHSAGKHIRNIGRALRGKEPLTDIKPNGKLAKLVEAPFRTEIKSIKSTIKTVDKAIAAVDRLEKAAAAEREEGKPSAKDTMKGITGEDRPKQKGCSRS